MYIHDCIKDAIMKGMHRTGEEEAVYDNTGFEPEEEEEDEEEEQDALYENYDVTGNVLQPRPMPSPFIDLDWMVYEDDDDGGDEAALYATAAYGGGVNNEMLELENFRAAGGLEAVESRHGFVHGCDHEL